MSECKKCGQELEWPISKKTGKPYPINAGTKPGMDNYFHSSTCGKTTQSSDLPIQTADKVDNGLRDVVDAIKDLTQVMKSIEMSLANISVKMESENNG